MPLESATYISDLQPNNPAVTDPTSQGDDHIRLIKSALKTSFGSFTGSPVTASEAELNSAIDAVNTDGVSKLSDTGAFFKTDSDTGVTNPATNTVALEVGGLEALRANPDKSIACQGALSTVSGISGPGAIPVGGMIMWPSNTLPDDSWAWANGDTYLRSNTALWAALGTTYGTGDGTTTANLPDMRARVPIGRDTMGGSTYSGRVPQFAVGTLAETFGEAQHAMTTSEMPEHNHAADVSDGGHNHAVHWTNNLKLGNGGDSRVAMQSISTAGTDGAGATNTSNSNITVSIRNFGSSVPHNNVQPSLVCNYIIRVS